MPFRRSLLIAIVALALPRALPADPPLATVLRIFREISKTYRPSGHEGQARQLVLGYVEAARALGFSTTPTVQQDAHGNLVVHVPATGRFAGRGLPEVGIQTHLDMVLAVRGARAGEDLAPWFSGGVSIRETDGWLHSTDHRTTLGADNGVGVAMALRYLLDPTIPHPPLALAFTVSEEVGMVGATNFAIPLDVAVLLNLDGEEHEVFCRGCQGGGRVRLSGTVRSTALPAGLARVRVAVTGLLGGHSGVEIHERRANAARLMARLLVELGVGFPGYHVVQAGAGTPGVINKIADAFELTLALPPGQVPGAVVRAAAFLKDTLRAEFPEDFAKSRIEVETAGANVALFGLDRVRATTLARGILDVGNGVLTRGEGLPNGVNTSSNIGYWTVGTATAAGVECKMGLMARSFDAAELRAAEERAGARLRRAYEEAHGTAQLEGNRTDPWLLRDSWLLSLAQREFPRFRIEAIAGGLELAPFSHRQPGIPMLGFGPLVEKPHTPEERVQIASIGSTTETLDRLLGLIGDSPDFPEGCGQKAARAAVIPPPDPRRP